MKVEFVVSELKRKFRQLECIRRVSPRYEIDYVRLFLTFRNVTTYGLNLTIVIEQLYIPRLAPESTLYLRTGSKYGPQE